MRSMVNLVVAYWHVNLHFYAMFPYFLLLFFHLKVFRILCDSLHGTKISTCSTRWVQRVHAVITCYCSFTRVCVWFSTPALRCCNVFVKITSVKSTSQQWGYVLNKWFIPIYKLYFCFSGNATRIRKNCKTFLWVWASAPKYVNLL